MSQRSQWLGALVFLFFCVCAGLTAVLGGVVAIRALFPEVAQTSAPPLDVQVEPALLIFKQGERGTLQLILRNPTAQPQRVEAIGVPSSWWAALVVVSSDPPYTRLEEIPGERLLIYEDVVVQPGSELVMRLELKALKAARLRDLWSVYLSETELIALDLEVLIEEAEPTPTPVLDIPTPQGTPTDVPAAQGSTPTPALSVTALAEHLARSVVMIIALQETPHGLEPVWSGSGTVVDAQGYVLTNAHVVLSERFQPVDDLLVLISERVDEPPVPAYRARVVQADPKLDLAVLQLDRDAEGNPLEAPPPLPPVPLGDSDQLRLGEPLLILGYPGIGGDTITLTRGEVSGFISQPGYGNRAWIKTSATIAGGSSGGLAANLRGELVGIPTRIGVQDQEVVDCRPIVDTNGDGVVDDRDTCVPIGGYLNALRPINLAKPLIQAALTGQVALPTSAPGDLLLEDLQVVFYEPFDNAFTGYWREERDDLGFSRYLNGRFLVQIQTTEYLFWFSYTEARLQDMAVQITAEIVRPTGSGDIGVLCREDQDRRTFYAFSVSEDGYYSIWLWNDGDPSTLIPWRRLPPELRPEPEQPFTVQALCRSHRLTLLVNGQMVDFVEDATLSVGYGGFFLGTWDRPNFSVAFDDFYVYRIP